VSGVLGLLAALAVLAALAMLAVLAVLDVVAVLAVRRPLQDISQGGQTQPENPYRCVAVAVPTCTRMPCKPIALNVRWRPINHIFMMLATSPYRCAELRREKRLMDRALKRSEIRKS